MVTSGQLTACILFAIPVFLSLFLEYLSRQPVENIGRISRMAEASEDNLNKFKEMKQSAFVLGYTGEVGKALVKELLSQDVFNKLVLIGRREVKFEEDLYKNVEQKVIDFEKLDEHADAFQGFDQGFSCLGTTRGKAGATGFKRVDYDYVVNTAQLAKNGGCKHFHLISSQGADKNSSFLYPQTKGLSEAAITDMGFDRLSIYRPGVLMCNREEKRTGEAVFRFLLKPVDRFWPGSISTKVSVLTRAVVNCLVSPKNEPVELFENKAIHKLAGN